MRLSKIILVAGLSLGIGLLALAPSRAQVPSVQNPPYNVDLGALITNSLRTASTVQSATQTNLNWRGVLCKFLETVSSGTPSTTFSIQSYDAATASWQTLATSGAVTSTTGNPASILIYPGAAMTTTPSGWVLNAIYLPRTWRINQVVGSGAGAASPATTSKIGCNYLN